RSAPSFESRLSDTGRVRGEIEGARRTVRAGNGSDRCGMWGLRVPTRCITVPRGALEARGKGGRLKLSVDRRIWAGHWVAPTQWSGVLGWVKYFPCHAFEPFRMLSSNSRTLETAAHCSIRFVKAL